MQINKQGTAKNSQNYFCPKVARFSDMPVCLKSGITAKPLYVRIHNFGFRCVITMCILCNFFAFLFFLNNRVMALFMLLFLYFSVNLKSDYIESLCCYLRFLDNPGSSSSRPTLQTPGGLTIRSGKDRCDCLRNSLDGTGLSWRQIKTCTKLR